MKLWQIIVLVALAGFISVGIYTLRQEEKVLGAEAEKLKAELHTLQDEQEEFASRIEYLAHPENLIKEIKSQFNYRTPDEKLILIVPDTTTTTEE